MGEGLSSKLTELCVLVFGVGGVTPVAETLPMNQDCKGEPLIQRCYTNEQKRSIPGPIRDLRLPLSQPIFISKVWN